MRFTRSAAQQTRLLTEDFPWLWGLRHHWKLGENEIAVVSVDASNPPAEFREFLIFPSSADQAVWAYHSDPSELCVERIPAYNKAPWGLCLLGSRRGEITSAAYIIKADNDRERFVIFRPKRAPHLTGAIRRIMEEHLAPRT